MQTRDPAVISIANLSLAEYDPERVNFMPNKRGNPNWGRSGPLPPATATAFEMQVRHLHLAPEAYVFSDQLRIWCKSNRNRCYIPEWLLDEWQIRVDANLSDST